MTTKNALIIEDAYLHSEDATGLEDMIVQASGDTVDITVRGRDLAICLDAADLAAMQRLVTEATTPRFFPGSTLSGVQHIRAARDAAMRAAETAVNLVGSQKELGMVDAAVDALGPQGLEGFPWQPNWAEINPKLKFVTRDKHPNQTWGWRVRPIKNMKSSIWYGGNGQILDCPIPDDVDWEILHERPVEIIFHKHPDDWRLDWSQVPSPYKYVCKDQGGKVFGYVHAPIRDSICWIAQIEDQTFDGCVELPRELIADHIAWQIIHMRPADPESTEPIPWQLDWTGINWRVKFICKDENEKAWGFASRPNLGTSMWNLPGGGWRMVGLDGQIPGNWREILIERPE